MTGPTLRQRLTRGAAAQAALQGTRLLVQVGTVAVLAGTWGVQLFGEWLILFALPAYLTVTDFGLFAAATTDMIMRVSRGDRDGALAVFQAVAVAVTALFGAIALAVTAIVVLAPITSWLNLEVISEADAGWILVMFSGILFLVAYASLTGGGLYAVGRYAEAVLIVAGIALLEFVGLAVVVILGGEPVQAAGAMLACRAVGTFGMYVVMRRHAPWLRFGWPAAMRTPLRPLLIPALASAALAGAIALNVQGMVVLLGAALGPVSVAVFSTVRTMTRSAVQMLGAIVALITPEISRAFAEEDHDRLRRLHRVGCQAAVWLGLPLLLVLAVLGDEVVRVWTSGGITVQDGELLYLLIAVAGLHALWFTSFSVVLGRNRHQRLALRYLIASAVALPMAYVLVEAIGLEGAGAALLALEAAMVGMTLRETLPIAHDTLRGWLSAVSRPPRLRSLVRRSV